MGMGTIRSIVHLQATGAAAERTFRHPILNITLSEKWTHLAPALRLGIRARSPICRAGKPDNCSSRTLHDGRFRCLPGMRRQVSDDSLSGITLKLNICRETDISPRLL